MRNFRMRRVVTTLLLLMSMNFVVMGIEWKKVDLGFDECRIDFVHKVGKYQLAFAQGGAVYRREVGENKWNIVVEESDSFPQSTYRYNSYPTGYDKMQVINGDSVIFATDDSSTYFSVDSGANWTKNYEHFYVYGYKKNDDGNNWYKIWNDTLFRSRKLNSGWEPILTDTAGDRLYEITFGDYGNWVGGWGKAFYSSSSLLSNWECFTEGLPERCVITTIKNVTYKVVLASTNMGLYISNDKGQTWKLLDDTFNVIKDNRVREIVIPKADEFPYTIAHAITDKGIFKVDVVNETITEIELPFNDSLTPQDITFIDNKYVVVTHFGVYESDDYGITWGPVISEGLSKKVAVSDIYKDGNSIVAKINAHFAGEFQIRESILSKSLDKGASWDLIDGSIDNLIGIKPKVVYHNEDTIFSFFFSTLLRSFDNGVTFDTLNSSNLDYYKGFLKVGDRVICSGLRAGKGGRPYTHTYDHYGDSLVSSFGVSYGIYLYHDTIWAKREGNNYLYSTDSGTIWSDEEVSPKIHINSIVQSGDFAIGVSDSAMYFSIDSGYKWNILNTPFDLSTYKASTNVVPQWVDGEPAIIIDSTVFLYNNDEVYSAPLSAFYNDMPIKHGETLSNTSPVLCNVTAKAIQLNVTSATKSNYMAQLLSPNGREIRRFSGKLLNGSSSFKLDCSGISNGFYILKLEAKGISVNRPILLTN